MNNRTRWLLQEMELAARELQTAGGWTPDADELEALTSALVVLKRQLGAIRAADRRRCAAQTKRGRPCRNLALPDRALCELHGTPRRAAGGAGRSRAA